MTRRKPFRGLEVARGCRAWPDAPLNNPTSPWPDLVDDSPYETETVRAANRNTIGDGKFDLNTVDSGAAEKAPAGKPGEKAAAGKPGEKAPAGKAPEKAAAPEKGAEKKPEKKK